jgi:alcohol dehydrogenase (cytochrome c)
MNSRERENFALAFLRPRSILIALLIPLLGIVTATVSSARVRAGLVILRSKATGSLPDIAWMDLFRMMRSGQHFGLPSLAANNNPYAAIQNPYSTPPDILAGSDTFSSRCASCHGSNGEGGPGGPRLKERHMEQGSSEWAIFKTISNGIRGTGMPPNDLPWVSRWQLVAFVRSISAATGADLAQLANAPARDVTYDAIKNPDSNPGSWLTYSGSYDSRRFSPDRQIAVSNVLGLRLLWERQYNASEPSVETTPIVVDDSMFVTLPPGRVEALNASTGALIWSYDVDVPSDLRLCCGMHNRGFAVLGSVLYFGTLDAHLVALDIHTGRLLWNMEIADYKKGYSITGAPLALKNMVITGIACGEFGAPGFITARDPATGREIWRFNTIPQPGQPGAGTWAGDSSQRGGGPTWLTGSFDPKTNVLYWPVGNPSPDYDGSARLGDNLYTDSVVALDADNGTLSWYFQFTPHDVFDWDSAQILVLFDGEISGEKRRLLAQGNRNGFYYLLDAETGKFLLAKSFAKQTWASGVDSHGRPILVPGGQPTETGTSVFPGVGGAVNWQSPSYSPLTKLIYEPSLERGGVFTTGHSAYHKGALFLGGSFEDFSEKTARAAVRALDPTTGEMVWEYGTPATSVGGLLSTGGGLLFGSQGDRFFALDAKTGHEIWQVGVGGRSTAAPITFMNDGKQLVTIAAGHDILTFGL